jgi:hypothetical protein
MASLMPHHQRIYSAGWCLPADKYVYLYFPSLLILPEKAIKIYMPVRTFVFSLKENALADPVKVIFLCSHVILQAAKIMAGN